MTPVFQTKLPPKHRVGNCLAAVFASLLDLPIDEVPNFEVLQSVQGSLWKTVLEAWLLARGLRLCNAPELLSFHQHEQDYTTSFPFNYDDAPYIAIGTVGEGYHVAIYANGRLVHDPTPTGGGLATFTEVQVLGQVPSSSFVPHFSNLLRVKGILYSTVPQIPTY